MNRRGRVNINHSRKNKNYYKPKQFFLYIHYFTDIVKELNHCDAKSTIVCELSLPGFKIRVD
jgi:hypothetical protein